MCSRTAFVCWLAAALVAVCAQRRDLYEGDACKRVAGVDWTCKKLKDCAKAQENLKNGVRPESCGFSDNVPIVCCEPTTANTDTRQPPPTQPSPRPPQLPPTRPRPPPSQPIKRPTQPSRRPTQSRGGKSKEMCKKYAESVFHNVTTIFGQVQTFNLCALGIEPLITNGTKAEPREFPHMALIGYEGRNKKISWSCGGSLISERWVLSAAHCTLEGDDRPKWVRLGEYNVKSTEDEDNKSASSEDFDIVEHINHPQYNSTTQYNDIALYKLGRNVVFDEYKRPICLQTEFQIPIKEGLITGWGRIGYSQKQSDVLLKGNVTFISGNDCRASLKTIKNLKREVQDNTMICAANFETNTDTCQGDSGGPLQYLLNEPFCMYSQVGVTSVGIRCASKFPAIYTRVSHFVPWIESIVWP